MTKSIDPVRLLRRPTKDGETVRLCFISSPFSDFYLFNMLIINGLNRQKTQKAPF